MISITKRDLTFFISGILICLFMIWFLEYLNIEYASNPSDKDNINNRITFYKDSLKKLKITDLNSVQLALLYTYLSDVTYNKDEYFGQLTFSSYGKLLNFEKNVDKAGLYTSAYDSFIKKFPSINYYLEVTNPNIAAMNSKQKFEFASKNIINKLNSFDKLIIEYLDKQKLLSKLVDENLTPLSKTTLMGGGTDAIKKLFGLESSNLVSYIVNLLNIKK